MKPYAAILSFLLACTRLKTLKRTGWVWRGLRNPETIAEHSFRLGLFAWVLGSQTDLSSKRLIEMALLHDICEAKAGDLTPYFGMIPSDTVKRQKMLLRWIRASQQQKTKLSQERVAKEKRALEALLKKLPPHSRQKLFATWVDFEYGKSSEGRFAKQIDKIEAMLQAIEYFGTAPNTWVVGWWEEIEEIVDHPLLKKFVKTIQARLYDGKRSDIAGELKFLMDAGKLKRKPKRSWVIRNVKNPDSLANHAFFLSLMTILLAEKLQLSTERLLKMALLFHLPYALIQDGSSYDDLLEKAATKKEKRETLSRWVRLSLTQKRRMFEKRITRERKALKKLVSGLPSLLTKEMTDLWEELKKNQTQEARFVNQAYVLELLLQALLYWSEDKKFPIKPWWEWAFEHSDSVLNLEFMEALKQKFLGSK